ncbi:CLOCK-interacting pacemaker [Hemicordylus capensis]|uniref:CLOCK-interacting pacemaker n=1 Tax=Hemicordylus capensis TaxID=884348 RepID=UPI002302B4E8|nr:CLOCK-interacting pacemaker [Hemicordylus capensis]XP_053123290.1 CLOCK-interacting pacemaker [Hemicordylus capensis]XP_053123291.1 CLOCK-interacting pacemaker [Hemicordylus capensis]
MPSDETPLPGLLPKPGKEEPTPARSLKAESPLSKGHAGQSARKAGGGGAAWKSRHPASEGEKDSGFSDVSSEYLSNVEQTDTEEQPACPLRRPARLQRVPPKASAGLPGSAFTGITPLYIVKNVLLKQPLGASPTTQLLAWSSQHPLDGSQGSPARVLFIQQPVAALKPLLPGRKAPAKDTSLPVLSAYPRIAPHPGRDPKAPLPGGASQNKRFCLEETWVSSSEPAAPTGGREPPPLLCPPAGLGALSQDTVTSSTSPALPGLDPAEGRMISRACKKLGCSSVGKQRRFHNTVEILRKSGLLSITLRTKELIRQSSSTQRELAELREHAQLLCEAVQSNDPQAWARLQEAMSRSAAYWASKGAGSCAPRGRQGAGAAEGVGPSADAAGESPPSSPMNLSLAPDALVPVALP